jgi:hypothetical protein
MAQSFTCICGSPACKGQIGGAKDMTPKQLAGVWLNGYIREMLEERDGMVSTKANAIAKGTTNGVTNGIGVVNANGGLKLNESHIMNGHGGKMNSSAISFANGGNDDAEVRAGRNGPTSRELSGEMGGDTTAA